jgi:hypothetical protein
MEIGKQGYTMHSVGLNEITRSKNLIPKESAIMQKIIGHSGYEATIDETLERLEMAKDIINEYKAKNKLQDSRTTKLGFDIS